MSITNQDIEDMDIFLDLESPDTNEFSSENSYIKKNIFTKPISISSSTYTFLLLNKDKIDIHKINSNLKNNSNIKNLLIK